ncbi:MAG: phosphoribosyltransferase family protein [Candidatus Zixiibacteriota bacterium]
MSEFNQNDFNEFVVSNGVYGFFDNAITLKSGRLSHFYANWRNVVEDAWLTEILIGHLLAFVEDKGIAVETYYGVPEGATKLGILAQFESARRSADYSQGSHSLAMGRAKPKDHGAPRDRYFVGMPRGKTLVLEDVTTTGGSLISTLDFLIEAGVEVIGVISLTNRMEKRNDGLSVEDIFAQKNIPFYCMSSALDVLPIVYEKLKPGVEIAKAIESEYEEYGLAKIRLL